MTNGPYSQTASWSRNDPHGIGLLAIRLGDAPLRVSSDLEPPISSQPALSDIASFEWRVFAPSLPFQHQRLHECFCADEAPLRATELAQLGYTEAMIWNRAPACPRTVSIADARRTSRPTSRPCKSTDRAPYRNQVAGRSQQRCDKGAGRANSR